MADVEQVNESEQEHADQRNRSEMSDEITIDRRDGGDDRRKVNIPVEFDRRRGPGRRRPEERRSAEEGEMTAEQFEFVLAVNEYKKVNNRQFPTLTEVLDIIKAIGYRKVAKPEDIR